MRSVKRTITAFAAISTAAVVAASSTTSVAAAPVARSDSGPSGKRVLVGNVSAPFQVVVRGRTVFYLDAATGQIDRITPSGPRGVLNVPFASAFEFSRDGKTMAIAIGSDGEIGSPAPRVTLVRGGRLIHARVSQFEHTVNPDRNQTYGLLGPASAQCRTDLDSASRAPLTYKGRKGSSPSQVEALPRGAFAVADAGGNSILRISRQGLVSLIAVLPPQVVRLTQAQADAVFAPSCKGATVAYEAWPTDVERGPGGALWVTTLPSTPAANSFHSGAIYRIKRGVVTKMAGGFFGASNLDLVRGRFYVTEWYGNKVTKLGKGGRFTRYNVSQALAVEATRKKLFIGTFSPRPEIPGKILRLPR